MKPLAIVRQDAPDRWTARSAALPGFEASGATEAAALEALQRDLAASLAGGRLVEIEVPVNGTVQANPWLAIAGWSKDDPTWDDYLAGIAKARAENDAP
jgi:hypothetical protein